MRSALGFLTILGGSAGLDARAVRWFAPVGGLVGLSLGAAWWGADQLWPPLLAATLIVALDALLTGMLHLDGLADSGDGLLAPMERQRRLAVMRDPTIGAFGVVVLTMVLLVRVGALTSLTPNLALLAGLWAASRGAMAVALVTVPYARASAEGGGGLATAFVAPAGGARGAVVPAGVGTVAALGVVMVAGGVPAGAAAAAGLLVGGAGVVYFAYRQLGGFTGDVLGAAGVIGETCGLMLAAAQW